MKWTKIQSKVAVILSAKSFDNNVKHVFFRPFGDDPLYQKDLNQLFSALDWICKLFVKFAHSGKEVQLQMHSSQTLSLFSMRTIFSFLTDWFVPLFTVYGREMRDKSVSKR